MRYSDRPAIKNLAKRDLVQSEVTRDRVKRDSFGGSPARRCAFRSPKAPHDLRSWFRFRPPPHCTPEPQARVCARPDKASVLTSQGCDPRRRGRGDLVRSWELCRTNQRCENADKIPIDVIPDALLQTRCIFGGWGGRRKRFSRTAA